VGRGVGSGEDVSNERTRRRTQARARSLLRPRRPSAAKRCAGVGSKRVMSTPRSGVAINFSFDLIKKTSKVACGPYPLCCGSEAAIYRYAGDIAKHLNVFKKILRCAQNNDVSEVPITPSILSTPAPEL
jgi:hypothetical protein